MPRNSRSYSQDSSISYQQGYYDPSDRHYNQFIPGNYPEAFLQQLYTQQMQTQQLQNLTFIQQQQNLAQNQTIGPPNQSYQTQPQSQTYPPEAQQPQTQPFYSNLANAEIHNSQSIAQGPYQPDTQNSTNLLSQQGFGQGNNGQFGQNGFQQANGGQMVQNMALQQQQYQQMMQQQFFQQMGQMQGNQGQGMGGPSYGSQFQSQNMHGNPFYDQYQFQENFEGQGSQARQAPQYGNGYGQQGQFNHFNQFQPQQGQGQGNLQGGQFGGFQLDPHLENVQNSFSGNQWAGNSAIYGQNQPQGYQQGQNTGGQAQNQNQFQRDPNGGGSEQFESQTVVKQLQFDNNGRIESQNPQNDREDKNYVVDVIDEENDGYSLEGVDELEKSGLEEGTEENGNLIQVEENNHAGVLISSNLALQTEHPQPDPQKAPQAQNQAPENALELNTQIQPFNAPPQLTQDPTYTSNKNEKPNQSSPARKSRTFQNFDKIDFKPPQQFIAPKNSSDPQIQTDRRNRLKKAQEQEQQGQKSQVFIEDNQERFNFLDQDGFNSNSSPSKDQSSPRLSPKKVASKSVQRSLSFQFRNLQAKFTPVNPIFSQMAQTVTPFSMHMGYRQYNPFKRRRLFGQTGVWKRNNRANSLIAKRRLQVRRPKSKKKEAVPPQRESEAIFLSRKRKSQMVENAPSPQKKIKKESRSVPDQ